DHVGEAELAGGGSAAGDARAVGGAGAGLGGAGSCVRRRCRLAHPEREARDHTLAGREAGRNVAHAARGTGECLAVGHRSTESPSTPALWTALAAPRVEDGAHAGARRPRAEDAVPIDHTGRSGPSGARFDDVRASRLPEHASGVTRADDDGERVVLTAR